MQAAHKLPYRWWNSNKDPRCGKYGDVPAGLSIVSSHCPRDDPGRTKDVDGSCCFRAQQPYCVCDWVAHLAVWLYSRECVLHLHKRIQSSGMVEGAERPTRIGHRHKQRTAHWRQTNERL